MTWIWKRLDKNSKPRAHTRNLCGGSGITMTNASIYSSHSVTNPRLALIIQYYIFPSFHNLTILLKLRDAIITKELYSGTGKQTHKCPNILNSQPPSMRSAYVCQLCVASILNNVHSWMYHICLLRSIKHHWVGHLTMKDVIRITIYLKTNPSEQTITRMHTST